MADSNKYRHGNWSGSLGDEIKQDLSDLSFVTGVPEVQIVRLALREYARQRARYMKPTTLNAHRLIARYGVGK